MDDLIFKRKARKAKIFVDNYFSKQGYFQVRDGTIFMDKAKTNQLIVIIAIDEISEDDRRAIKIVPCLPFQKKIIFCKTAQDFILETYDHENNICQ